MRMCFPSSAPRTCGKFHLLSYSLATAIHSCSIVGVCIIKKKKLYSTEILIQCNEQHKCVILHMTFFFIFKDDVEIMEILQEEGISISEERSTVEGNVSSVFEETLLPQSLEGDHEGSYVRRSDFGGPTTSKNLSRTPTVLPTTLPSSCSSQDQVSSANDTIKKKKQEMTTSQKLMQAAMEKIENISSTDSKNPHRGCQRRTA